jgi:hypothetical protein
VRCARTKQSSWRLCRAWRAGGEAGHEEALSAAGEVDGRQRLRGYARLWPTRRARGRPPVRSAAPVWQGTAEAQTSISGDLLWQWRRHAGARCGMAEALGRLELKPRERRMGV